MANEDDGGQTGGYDLIRSISAHYLDALIGCDPRVVELVAEWAQLKRDNERLRAREAEWDSKEQALQKSIAEHGRVIAKLEARLEEQGAYNHRLVRRLADAMETVRAVANGSVEVGAFGKTGHTKMRVLCLQADVRTVLDQARALLASGDEAK